MPIESGLDNRPRWSPKRDDYRAHVHEVFSSSAATRLIGASLGRVDPGYVDVELPCHAGVTQQQGFVHGGILGVIADAAASLSALSVAPSGTVGVTIEFKINLLEVASGEKVVARGRLIRPGETVSVAAADVFAISATGRDWLVATALVTLAGVTRRRRIPAQS